MSTQPPSATPRPERPGGPRSAIAVRTDSLAKSFGPTQALASCSFELASGEVHAILGENGSGKSTLVKILSGLHAPDGGTMELEGAPFAGFSNPREAIHAGVIAVFQEILISPPRSVFENVWLGPGPLFRDKLTREAKVDRAAEVLEELLGEVPDLDTPAEDFSLSGRQAFCIARALVRSPRILILDEATSALDVATRDRLFAILARLVAGGTSVIFISHRMDEIEEVGDRVTVMRLGRTVGTFARGERSSGELISLMTGDERATAGAAGRTLAHQAPGEVVLRARDVRLRPGAKPVELDLRAGELVGLAGLEGQGQDRFLHVLRGADPSGTVTLERDGGEVVVRSPRHAFRNGVAYVPNERRGEALLESKSVLENFGLPTLGRDVRLGLVSDRSTARRFGGYVAQLGIKLGSSQDPITTLSGGNQQKVVMARWLAAEPRILLLNDPTRGVDAGAKSDIYELLVKLSEEGIATVMLSTEVDEHVTLMDRVLVFREGEATAEISRENLTSRALVANFFGQDVEGAAP